MRWNEGDKTELENYRPVTCPPAAAKLLEKVACEQTSKYRHPSGHCPVHPISVTYIYYYYYYPPASEASRGVYDPCLN